MIRSPRPGIRVSLRGAYAIGSELSPYVFQVTSNFFSNTPEEHQNETLEQQIKSYYRKRISFLNPEKFYGKYANREYKEQERPWVPPMNFGTIINQNTIQVPVKGSIVEIVDPTDSKIIFGVVIREQQARFDEKINKLLVLTSENEIIQVPPIYIKFHLYSIIPNSYISFQDILDNRHDPDNSERSRAVELLRLFIEEAWELMDRLRPDYSRLFLQIARDRIQAISLTEIIEKIKFKEAVVIKSSESYFNQGILLTALHWGLLQTTHWLVPNYMQNSLTSNIYLHGHSNSYISFDSIKHLCNLLSSSYLLKFRTVEHDLSLKEMNSFLNDFYQQQLKAKGSASDIEVYFYVQEGRKYKYLFDVLKFVLIYPHPSIMRHLISLDVFKNIKNPSDIYQILQELGIYDNEKITDPLLSSGLCGKYTHFLSCADVNELDSSSTEEADYFKRDLFKQLRGERKYYNDDIIIGLPLDNKHESSTQLGI
ncbi:uncharacterized protein J8A68_001588 [[Candida] subhashii]|uniref:Uncharacterized protein n=1 Tax=[Candida] subhashii TaxID=561895 RepID=A0A8J5UZK4_9ASCO|nr:uncharacterized protein J8A68_001588 [[Candida] subhashii]KAG7664895.1 hypothetical protein J8A68_001588 [[Candida] subhashii]